jgi:signal peptidase II
VGTFSLAVDQATKAWAQASLPYNRSVKVIPGWLSFGLIRNSGASFSAFSGHNEWLLPVVAVLLLAIALVFWRGLARDRTTVIALALILGGGLSNLIDRVRLQAVVDFIQVGIWPADFNLADLAIRGGALTLVVTVLLNLFHRPA